jgi:ATP-dependent DNA ligase
MIVPMQPSNYREPFSDSGWLFEPKWDGYRAICHYDHGNVRFISRRNNDLTKRFPELQSIQVRAEFATIDGEIVAIDSQGLPCFEELRKTRRSCAVVKSSRILRNRLDHATTGQQLNHQNDHCNH